MEATLTLHQAADRLGVEHTDLNRLIRIGALPEAHKLNRPEGKVWVIDESHLPAVASRNAWTIDLRSTVEVDAGSATESENDNHTGNDNDNGSGNGNDNGSGNGNGADTGSGDEGESATDAGTDRGSSGSVHSPSTSGKVGSGTVDLNGARTEMATIIRTPAPATGGVGAEADDGGALVPHRSASPDVKHGDGGQQLSPTADGDENDGQVSTTDAIDLALLERLLASHEDRVAAQVREQEARHALAALNDAHNRTTGELDIERRERMAAAERYREERRSRAAAEAKVAELRDRVAREMELAEAEKAEKTAALNRSFEAERDAANAVALLGWRARRRYRKISEGAD